MSDPTPVWQLDALNELASVQIDPLLSEVFTEMKEYDALLAGEYIGHNEVVEITNSLDSQWNQLMGASVKLTGIVAFPEGGVYCDDDNLTPGYWADQEMFFFGALPVPVNTNYADETHEYVFRLRLARNLGTPEEPQWQLGIADTGELASIEIPGMMSSEAARAWLWYYHPEVIQEIDVALLNPATEECEMVMKLRDAAMDMRMGFSDGKEFDERSVHALNVYMHALFAFDDDIGYEIGVQGAVWTPRDEGGYEAAYVGGRTVAAVDALVWTSAVNEPEYLVRPHLVVRFLSDDKDDAGMHLLMPLTTATHFISMRYQYFVGYEDNQ